MVPLKAIENFIDKYWDGKSPLLVAFSGGPDSLALLHMILQCGGKYKIGLAHIDHGWRKESGEEAQKLKLFAESLGLPFHLKILDPKQLKGNLEAACRLERLRFFAELVRTHHYQAVLLGHHADDQAETVLKKVLEGSQLLFLSGLQPTMRVEGVTLWRPMLEWTKEMILDWNKIHHLDSIEDWTNLDSKFLRGKFRKTIIPELSKAFGKEVSRSLCRLGKEATEFRDYMTQQIAPYLDRLFTNHYGVFLDLSHSSSLPLFELKYLIKHACEKVGFSLPQELFDKIIACLLEGKADCQFYVHGKKIFVDRQCLFIITRDYDEVPDFQLKLELGSFVFGPWCVDVGRCDDSIEPCSHWKDLWKKGGTVVLPEGNYALRMPFLNINYPGNSSIRKWWTNHKVPAFLRLKVPVICGQNGEVFHEFLSGRMKLKRQKQGSGIKVCLSL